MISGHTTTLWQKSMDTSVIYFIVFGVVSGSASGGGILPDDLLNAAVRESVILKTSLAEPDKPFLSVGWALNDTNIITTNINFTAAEFKGRTTLFSNGSLEIRSLRFEDSGVYKVNILPDGKPFNGGSTRIVVHEPVSSVVATANHTDLVEFNSSVRLSCSASGSSLSFVWMNGSSVVTPSDRDQLTDGGSTLTIVRMTRYDQGPFRCRVSNPITEITSNPVNLSISYGPENVKIVGPRIVHFKENLMLTCSAVSEPAASYTWTLNGTEMHSSSVFTKDILNYSDSGSYMCEALNPITRRTSAAVHRLTVTDQSPSGYCSVGIIIACLITCAAAAGAGY